MNNIENIYGDAPVEQAATTTQMMIGRQAQEVQAAMVVAKQFPRNEKSSYDRIMSACRRITLAKGAIYEFPRGGTKVRGASIRLAEAVAQAWGNIDTGIIELEQKNGESQVMAYAWDLETNTRQTKIFTVPHVRHTKNGAYVLTDPRDIYELVANQGARRVRSCILSLIPGDVVDGAMEECKKTLALDETPLGERLLKMQDVFLHKFNVTREMLEAFIGMNFEAFTEQTLIRLTSVYTSLKDGMKNPEDYFDMSIDADPVIEAPSKAEADADVDLMALAEESK